MQFLQQEISLMHHLLVINADDYYGTTCFKIIYDYLSTHSDDDKYRYCMVGYQLKTLLQKMVLLPAAYAPQMLIPI